MFSNKYIAFLNAFLKKTVILTLYAASCFLNAKGILLSLKYARQVRFIHNHKFGKYVSLIIFMGNTLFYAFR